jgi:C1A family cysteine protease
MLQGNRFFGAHRDAPDARDKAYVAPAHILKALPKSVDLRPQCPPVYDQRPLQSCTANATAAAVEFERMKHGLTPSFTPSRLFIYYNERKLLGTQGKDDGAPLREAIKSLAKQGDCPEHHWPYDPAKVNTEPSQPCYKQAVRYEDMSYSRLPQDLAHMKACLASGSPFVLAIGIYSGSEAPQAAKTDVMPVPKAGETFIGNHAVMAVGYEDDRQQFIARNSWGPKWGMAGYFWLPYAYAQDPKLAGDFWTLSLKPAR